MKNKIFLCTALLSVLALCGCNQKAEESFSQSDISSTAETTTVSVSTSATTSTTTAISTSSAVATTNTTTATTTTLKATATSESVTSVSDKVTETVKPDVTEDNSGNISIEDDGGLKIIVDEDIDVVIEEQQQPVNVEEPQNYNQDIYEKLGIKVNLTGTNEEQAHQYYEACKEAYPNLDWGCTDVDVSINLYAMRSPDAPDVYSMSPDEITALIQERLAGRDYHDLSLEELAQIAADCGPGCELGAEIYDYFNDLTSRDFNAGGWTIIG